jgi:pre-rRNA-processing protein TSR3
MHLSCVEALAAALIITGFLEEADVLLQKFKWGPTFIDLNREYLEAYIECENSDEIMQAQEEFMNSKRDERITDEITVEDDSSEEEEED